MEPDQIRQVAQPALILDELVPRMALNGGIEKNMSFQIVFIMGLTYGDLLDINGWRLCVLERVSGISRSEMLKITEDKMAAI